MHCDLKPSNVLLDSDMNVKLTDLGLAKMIGTLSKETENRLVFASRYSAKSVIMKE